MIIISISINLNESTKYTQTIQSKNLEMIITSTSN